MKLYTYEKAMILRGLTERKVIASGDFLENPLITKEGTFTNVFISAITDNTIGIICNEGMYNIKMCEIVSV